MERPTVVEREVRERTAASWAAALDAGKLDTQERAAIAAWLDEDRLNKGALARAQAALAMLSRTPATAAASAPDRRTLLATIGASCVAALGTWSFWPSSRLDTAVGEVRQMPLADGSNVVLDTASSLRPRFSRSRRTVRIDHGRALFRVAHDPARPFVVEAADFRVRAIGTMFSVDMTGPVEVLVAEGIVEVSGNSDPVVLRAGQRGRFGGASALRSVESVPPDVMNRELDWRDGRLELAGQSLAEAVATMNRYNSRPIVVADQGLAEAPLHGGFRTDDPEGFARVAALSLGARSRIEPDRIVIGR